MTQLPFPFRTLAAGAFLNLCIHSTIYGDDAYLTKSTSGQAVVSAFEPSGQQFDLSGPGVLELRAGFSATIEINGIPVLVTSQEGQPVGNPQETKEATPYGEVDVTTSQVDFPTEKVTLGLKMGVMRNEDVVLLQASLKNTGSQQIKLIGLQLLEMSAVDEKIKLNGQSEQWIVTPLDHSAGLGKEPVFSLDAFSARGEPINDYGTLYRGDGEGFLFGPVGEPTAYLSATFKLAPDGMLKFSLESQMSGILVDPGETRTGQEAALWFRPPREALAKWAEWVAATHHARTDKGPLDGWCSWYHLTSKIAGNDVLGIVEAVKNHPDTFRPQVIQIDDGYQDFDGVWDANAKFPARHQPPTCWLAA